MPGLKKNVIYVSNYLELQWNIFLLSEVKKFLLRISAKDFTLKEIFFSKKWKFISYF